MSNVEIPSEIFRAYDIRGIVDETLTEKGVFAIAKALATSAEKKGNKQFVVGRDGRLSGSRLMQQIVRGLRESGCDVLDLGMVPTPVVYFASYKKNIPNAIALTGSHNPKNYNGLKIIIDGETIYGEEIQNILSIVRKQNFIHGDGKYEPYDISREYVSYICERHHLSKKFKIVVDAGNGVAGPIACLLLEQLGCDVIPMYCDIDGNFPNHHPDPGVPENLHELSVKVIQEKADLGIAFDGDGDRLGLLDENGIMICPDRMLMLLSEELLSRKPNSSIIFDVKCTNLLHDFIKERTGIPIMWKTGHSLIKAKMREVKAELAAEVSGHIFFKDNWFGVDDALLAASRIVEIISFKDEKISYIFDKFPKSCATNEIEINVCEQSKFTIIDSLINNIKLHDAKLVTIDGLRVEFDYGWGLIRPSNTTPKLVARFEADSDKNLDKIRNIFQELLDKVFPNKFTGILL